MTLTRRNVITGSLLTAAAVTFPQAFRAAHAAPAHSFRISLAQWSLNRAFFSGSLDPLDFARITREKFGLEGVEYVNQFYFDTLNDKLVSELRNRADGEGVTSLLIMVDREGAIGAPDANARRQAVENHYRWADAAHRLGCHSIRVNAQSEGSWDEQMKLAADGLNQLAAYCERLGLNVLVENHGGLSSNATWLTGVMKLADNPRVGTLPDFGNFVIDRETGESYDRYKGTRELMPWARAVSAKSHGFDANGEESSIDYRQMLEIVQDAGYRGWIGVEYEGDAHPEEEGIWHTIRLLQRVRSQLES